MVARDVSECVGFCGVFQKLQLLTCNSLENSASSSNKFRVFGEAETEDLRLGDVFSVRRTILREVI